MTRSRREKNFKRFRNVIVFIIGIALLAIGYGIYAYKDLQPKYEFMTLLGQGHGKELDLRSYRVGEWDEMTYWPPYGNICDLGIKGYSPGGLNCKFSTDDGESYVLFLQNKELVYKLDIPRHKVDFATSEIKWPIKRQDAYFEFNPNKKSVALKTNCPFQESDDLDALETNAQTFLIRYFQDTKNIGTVIDFENCKNKPFSHRKYLGMSKASDSNFQIAILQDKTDLKAIVWVIKDGYTLTLPICDESKVQIEEQQGLSGEVYTSKELTAKDRMAVVHCPPADWTKGFRM